MAQEYAEEFINALEITTELALRNQKQRDYLIDVIHLIGWKSRTDMIRWLREHKEIMKLHGFFPENMQMFDIMLTIARIAEDEVQQIGADS